MLDPYFSNLLKNIPKFQQHLVLFFSAHKKSFFRLLLVLPYKYGCIFLCFGLLLLFFLCPFLFYKKYHLFKFSIRDIFYVATLFSPRRRRQVKKGRFTHMYKGGSVYTPLFPHPAEALRGGVMKKKSGVLQNPPYTCVYV